MSRRPSLQRGPRLVEQVGRGEHVADQAVALGDELPELLRTDEAAAFLRIGGNDPIKTFFKWADRNAVPRLHRGRAVLWEKRVLLDYLHGAKWTKRRSA